MGENSTIEWCHHTFNPWIGCTRVGPGCDRCYAARSTPARTMGIEWGQGQPRRRTRQGSWRAPLRWNGEAERMGVRYRVFCASLADWLDNEVPIEWLVDLLDLIRKTPCLDWLLLSKRVGNWQNRLLAASAYAEHESSPRGDEGSLFEWIDSWLCGVEPKNVWIGATVVNQEEADRDVPKLLAVPALVRWLSMEPLLGQVDLRQAWHGETALRGRCPGSYLPSMRGAPRRSIDWVVVGGESGSGARPMHPDWARSLRDQCKAAGVPLLFKQWGDWVPGEAPPWPENADYATECGKGYYFNDLQWMNRVGKKRAGRLLDGQLWDLYPGEHE